MKTSKQNKKTRFLKLSSNLVLAFLFFLATPALAATCGQLASGATCQKNCSAIEGLTGATDCMGTEICCKSTASSTGSASVNSTATPASGSFQYTLLESLPGFFQAGKVMTDFPALILAIYKFGIWTIGICALFMITIGGVMYLGSAGNTSAATNAKGIIFDALIGVFAAMVAYLFLYVINPDLTTININFTAVEIATEPAETSAEASGALGGGASTGTPGSCGGLATQSGIGSQCASASSQLADMLNCLATKLPSAVVSSVTDSKGYNNCTPDKWSSACAHAKNSCHYGGKTCYANGKSYAADISTRNLSASQIIAATQACGASYTKDESTTANHVHASVGQKAGCGCN